MNKMIMLTMILGVALATSNLRSAMGEKNPNFLEASNPASDCDLEYSACTALGGTDCMTDWDNCYMAAFGWFVQVSTTSDCDTEYDACKSAGGSESECTADWDRCYMAEYYF